MIIWPIQPTNKKYERWYNILIDKANNRTLPKVMYTETHHIVPRSFGGTDDKTNLVKLSAREHYVAHMLLWKMRFPSTFGSKMAFAFGTFINKFKVTNHTYKITSRVYATFKQEYSLLMSERMTGEGNNFYGKTHDEATRKIIGEKSKLKTFKRGPEHPSYGKTPNVSPEGKANQLRAIKEFWADPECKEMMAEKRKAFFESPAGIAQRQRHSARVKGVPRDPAIIEKTASKKRGKKEHEIYSPEAILIRKEALKNRVLSDEARDRIRESSRKVGQRPKSAEWKKKMSERMTGIVRPKYKCIHCGMEAVAGNINRWHNDNCKQKKPE
jgi:hypothetical protein